MHRIYDAAQQGLLACLTETQQEESLRGFLNTLRRNPAWSARDLALVEQEVRRLLSLPTTNHTQVVSMPGPDAGREQAKAGRIA